MKLSRTSTNVSANRKTRVEDNRLREFGGANPPVFTDFFPAELKEVVRPTQSFVGVWKKGDNYHEIAPFWDHLDFSQMFEECLAEGTLNPIVSPNGGTSGRLIHMYENSGSHDPIWLLCLDSSGATAEVSAAGGKLGRQFAAMAFVSELRRLLLRKRRTTYQTQQMTLAGRVKGKLLIGHTVRRHLGRGRMDLVECAVPVRTQENRVNQVFRYTLRLCKESLRTLPSIGVQTTWTWANFCDEILSDVSEIRSTRDSDYNAHGLTGFFKEHAKLLSLAKVIKKNHQEPGVSAEDKIKTTPFLLNTWLVFERWVRTRAKKAVGENWELQDNQNRKLLGEAFPGFTPDMVFKSREEPPKRVRILDVKYRKYWQEDKCPNPNNKEEKPDYDALRHDLHQILAYKTVFGAERVGIVFPSSGEVNQREDFEEHTTSKPHLCTLPVAATKKNGNKAEGDSTIGDKIDKLLEGFLC